MAAQPKPIHLLLLGCRGVGKTKLKDRYADAVRPAPITTGNKREDDRRDRLEQIRLKYGLGKMLHACMHGMSAIEICKAASFLCWIYESRKLSVV